MMQTTNIMFHNMTIIQFQSLIDNAVNVAICNRMSPLENIATYEQVRKRFDIANPTLHRWLSEGKIKSYSIKGSRRKYLKPTEVIAAMEINPIEKAISGLSDNTKTTPRQAA